LTYKLAGPKTRGTKSRNFKVTLGIVPDYASTESAGLRVDGVVEGKPAYAAGMQKGDIIVAMEGKAVKDIYDYMYRLGDFKVGQRISVDVKRGDEIVVLIVEL
jgi:S1-C subfamily serine protease